MIADCPKYPLLTLRCPSCQLRMLQVDHHFLVNSVWSAVERARSNEHLGTFSEEVGWFGVQNA